MHKSYKDIQGWFDFPDIYSRVIKNQLQDGDIFVEVGTWMGKSAAFAVNEFKKHKKEIDFYCVDLWAGSQDDESMNHIIKQHGGSIYEQFVQNMEDCDVMNYIKPIKGDSAKSANKFEDKSVSFCFIDALHTYDAVKRDVLAWLPKIKKDCYIGGHDADRECVRNALNETLGDRWYRDSERSWLCKM